MTFHSKKMNSIIAKALSLIGYKPKSIMKMIKRSQATVYRYLKQ